MNQTRVFTALAAIGLGLASAFSGCSQRAVRVVSRPIGATVAKPPPLSHPTRYLIRPQDLLFITFTGEPDYNQQVRVDWRGKIDVPSLAAEGSTELTAAGLTPVELANRITEFGRDNKILGTQRAQVFVSEYVSHSFTLLGQVSQPGRYFFEPGKPEVVELGEAIAMGGGYTRLARQSLVLVKRGAQVHRVDLRRLTTKEGGSFFVQPGDTITVTERIF